MKIILATLTIGVLAISSTFAQCGGCEGKEDGKKKEATKETATMSVVL